MRIQSPCLITSRLLPGITIGDGTLSIEYAGSTSDGRQRYRWYLDLADGSEFSGDDLASGVGGGSLQSGLESLLSFLSACGESVNYANRTGRTGENADLFPPAVAEWAAQNSDELVMAQIELSETDGLIDE